MAGVNTCRVITYLSDNEETLLRRAAYQLNMSRSELARRLILKCLDENGNERKPELSDINGAFKRIK